jgi:uncharacterized membrane protein
MNFHSTLFAISAPTGLSITVMGIIMLKFPPKEINNLYGYRTKKSVQSQERWDFAQVYSAKELVKMGIVITLAALTGVLLPLSHELGAGITITLLFSLFIIIFIKAEKSINKKFSTNNHLTKKL